MMDREQFGVLLVMIALSAILGVSCFPEIKAQKKQDKMFAESSVDQKLDALYQQNKEIKQAIEECKVWILVK